MIKICTSFASLAVALTLSWAAPAAASESCTAKCASTEQACIKRTNNKGQCGKAANECTAKCRKK